MTASPDPHRLTLVVDDHPVVRRGLVALLTGESWAGEIREAATVGDALTFIHSASPTFAVVDLKLPDGSGTSVVKALTSYAPGCRSVVLTMDGDARLVRAALDAGATGYLLKDTPPEDLVAALCTVADGGVVLGEQLGVARTDRGNRRTVSATLAAGGADRPARRHRRDQFADRRSSRHLGQDRAQSGVGDHDETGRDRAGRHRQSGSGERPADLVTPRRPARQ